MEPEIQNGRGRGRQGLYRAAEIPGVRDDIKCGGGNQVSISAEVKKEKEEKRARR